MYPAVIAGDIKFLQLLRVRPGLSGSCSRTLWMLCLVGCVVTVLRKFHTYGKVKVSAKTRTCTLARVSFGRDVSQAHALKPDHGSCGATLAFGSRHHKYLFLFLLFCVE